MLFWWYDKGADQILTPSDMATVPRAVRKTFVIQFLTIEVSPTHR
jgi:hypothetical protein